MAIYAALMSLVASLIDVCHFDRVLRMLAAYINALGQTQDSYRLYPLRSVCLWGSPLYLAPPRPSYVYQRRLLHL